MLKNKKITAQLMRYVVGGGLAAGIDLFFLYLFTDVFGIYYLTSSLFSFTIAFLFGFFFQKHITFQDHSKKHLSQGLRFLIFQVIGLGINVFLLRFLVSTFGFYYLYVAVFNKGIIFVRNFIMNYFYNFNHSGKNSQ